ncbi:MAG: helix-turn-helix domain-containing protein [Saprospiraceae bacterium]|nr:helix-turn-helix domain-containing protein [Saprospiraceae bacterium]
MKEDIIIFKLEQIDKRISDQSLLQKSVFNLLEAAQYLQLSTSHLYKLTSKKEIPHFIPNGKKIYFKRDELDLWLLRNRQQTSDEIEQQATDYLNRKKM